MSIVKTAVALFGVEVVKVNVEAEAPVAPANKAHAVNAARDVFRDRVILNTGP